jgi:hypothetical protein
MPNYGIGVCAGRKLHLSAKGGELVNSGIHAAVSSAGEQISGSLFYRKVEEVE